MTVTAHRFKATWRSITFNEHYDDSGIVDDPAHVTIGLLDKTELHRFEAVQVTVADYRELRQYLEGADPNEAYEGIRMLRLRGAVHGSTWGKLEDRVGALEDAFSVAGCRVAFAANDPPGLGPFDFKLESQSAPVARRFYCRPATGRPIVIGQSGGGLTVPYVAELVAFEPFMYRQSEETPVALPATVTNPGSLYARPRYEIAFSGAGATNLTITNTTTGQAFVINASTAATGETWVLDTATGTMYRSSDKANRYGARVSGWLSSMFLVPGANVLTTANASGVSSINCKYRAAYA